MPAFEQFDDAVLVGLKGVAGVRYAEEFSGDLTEAAMKKIAPHGGTILVVSLGGMPDREQPDTGQLAFDCRMAAYIITRNARGSVARGKEAKTLARQTMLTIRNNQWGLAGVWPADIERLENRTGTAQVADGIGLWLVVWKQTIYLDELPVDNSTPISHVTVQTAGSTEQDIIV